VWKTKIKQVYMKYTTTGGTKQTFCTALHSLVHSSTKVPFISQDLTWVPAWFRVSLQQPLLGVQVWWWVLQALQLHQRLHSRGTHSSRCPLLPPHRYTAERIQAAEHQLVAPSPCPTALCRFLSRQRSMPQCMHAALHFCCGVTMAVSLPLILQLLQHQEPGFGLLCAFRLPLISQPRGTWERAKPLSRSLLTPSYPMKQKNSGVVFNTQLMSPPGSHLRSAEGNVHHIAAPRSRAALFSPNNMPMISYLPVTHRQEGFTTQIFSEFSTRRQSFFRMKYKPNIWLQPGTANLSASPWLRLAADAWMSYSYTEQHSPETSQPLLHCWLQKKSFFFLLPCTLITPQSLSSSSTGSTVTASMGCTAASCTLLPKAAS